LRLLRMRRFSLSDLQPSRCNSHVSTPTITSRLSTLPSVRECGLLARPHTPRARRRL
jgi:hypothetical protein